jgi:hypothetical protein
MKDPAGRKISFLFALVELNEHINFVLCVIRIVLQNTVPTKRSSILYN